MAEASVGNTSLNAELSATPEKYSGLSVISMDCDVVMQDVQDIHIELHELQLAHSEAMAANAELTKQIQLLQTLGEA